MPAVCLVVEPDGSIHSGEPLVTWHETNRSFLEQVACVPPGVVAIDGPVITVAWRLASGEIREGLASASSLVLIRRPKDASRGAPRAK